MAEDEDALRPPPSALRPPPSVVTAPMAAMPTRLARTFGVWAEMVRLSHSVFALPFALVAALLAGTHRPGGRPAASQLFLVVLCMVAARSFAMTFNRIVDASIDARNPRTAGRPIPTGRITVRQARTFLLATGMLFLLACAGFALLHGNFWPLYLSLPTLGLAGAYSHAKRFTSTAHFMLGAAIAFSPVATWIAVDPGSLGWPALLLFGVVLLWIGGFDIVYACQDVAVDRRDGLFSLPARWGVGPALGVARGCHAVVVVLLVLLGRAGAMGWLYWAVVPGIALVLAVEHAMVRAADLSRIPAAFSLNGCVSLLFGAAAIGDVLLHPVH